MKTTLQKLSFIVILLFLTSTLFGQILLNEHFNTASLPAGWTNTAIQATKTWSFTNSPGFTTTSGSIYAKFLDDQPTTRNEAALITPAFNCTGRTSVKLQFEQFWDDVEQIHGNVDISTDGGTVWTTIYSDADEGTGDVGSYATPEVTTVDLTPYVVGESNVKLRFRFENVTSNAGKSWNIDDVIVYSDPDVAVIGFDTPVYLDCTAPYTNAELVTIRIKNYSIFSVSNVPYKVDVVTGLVGGISQTLTGTYVPVILPQEEITITFPADLIDMTLDDEYGFNCYTELAGDAYLENDTFYTSRRQWVTHYDHNENFNLTSEGWKRGGGNSRNY